MGQLLEEEIRQYFHSPVHYAIACHDYVTLQQILESLPSLSKAGEVLTESQSITAERNADKLSSVIDGRDVPGRETPLHLAVKLGDAVAVEMLMAAGADWSLQNEQGWSALQEAICAREEGIAMIITRYYQPLAWAKWCRRLPRITSTMRRMRDFYMEITFNFESSVIPFIARIAPSDTYRIWKRGSNLRADMTLAGFDGFKIQRADQSFLFMGEGSEDGKVPSGSLLVLTHKDKEITNALEGAGAQPSEAEIAQEVAVMSQTNMYRPGIDVTQAELVPQLTWRRQEKVEMVGLWKAKLYDMHHVMISVRSRKVPGAMTDEELLAAEIDRQEGDAEEDYTDLLTEEEKRQLEDALSMENVDNEEGSDHDPKNVSTSNGDNQADEFADDDNENVSASSSGPSQNGAVEPTGSAKDGKKAWFGWSRKSTKNDGNIEATGKVTKKLQKLTPDTSRKSVEKGSTDVNNEGIINVKKGKEKVTKRAAATKEPISKSRTTSSNSAVLESEYKKGLRPVLWLTHDFPLKTDELLPLLDILADKVKAIRRLRDLLTTKLPSGTFPVKVAIPVVPTIRVVVTFTKFEELKPVEEFCTPLSSPAHFQDAKAKEVDIPSSSSWFSWIRGSQNETTSTSTCLEDQLENESDPFVIPSDYTWVDMNEKKRRLKLKKAKVKKGKKPLSKTTNGTENDTDK